MSNAKEMIDLHGGAAKLASLLGYTVQRVQNWKVRGIPPRVRLDHPELFPPTKPSSAARAPRRRKNDPAPAN